MRESKLDLHSLFILATLLIAAQLVACGGDEASTPASIATQDVGETCGFDSHCLGGMCEAFGGSKVCTESCSDGSCPEGLSCSEGICAPSDFCDDRDGDGHGNGPGCAGLDCNEANGTINASSEERCGNGSDDDCDGETDEGCPAENNNNPDNNNPDDPCATPGPCGENATCTVVDESFTCACDAGFEGDGMTCTVIADPSCDPACSEFATCDEGVCACDAGYTGDGLTCEAIMGCEPACDANAVCADDGGTLTCMCNDGYTGDGLTCEANPSCDPACSEFATCDEGVCACDAGYTGDGLTCEAIMGCEPACDANAVCADDGGTLTCMCSDGYTGDGVTCADVDECSGDLDDCSEFATCANTDGGFNCTCNDGYDGDGVTCVELGPCDGSCSEFATCVDDGSGGETCECNLGFEGDGVTCVDINECERDAAACTTWQACTNIDGSYTCDCLPGTTGDDCTPLRSCAEIRRASAGSEDGTYYIDTRIDAPLEVYCDMTSDFAAGYTMVRIDSDTLGGGSEAYSEACDEIGLELIVPRTRAHARAIEAWNGEPPNLVGVYPQYNGAQGLSEWEGRCDGDPCTFYLSETNNSNCMGDEPNGDNDTDIPLYRTADGCDFGAWNDREDTGIDITGSVICSTNDAGPPTIDTCLGYLDSDSVHNASQLGISGVYTLASVNGSYEAHCDMVTDGGGWTLTMKADGRENTFHYDRNVWINDNLVNENEPGLSFNEAKLESWNAVGFEEILIFMNAPPESNNVTSIVIPQSADSLFALFSPDAYVATTLGREAWKGLIGGSSLQSNCNQEGFNVEHDGSRVRIGIVGNNEDNCDSPDSRLGIGGRGSACNQDGGMSVGNTSGNCSPDNGRNNSDAFAVILVR